MRINKLIIFAQIIIANKSKELFVCCVYMNFIKIVFLYLLNYLNRKNLNLFLNLIKNLVK